MGPFRLDPRRPIPRELHRALSEQIELATALMAAGRAWPAERRAASVHGFRKVAKRVRAALDLAREAGDRHSTDLVRQGFREAARALSRARDRDALGAILSKAARAVPRRRRAAVLSQWKAMLLPAPAPPSAGRTDRLLEEIHSRTAAMRRTWEEVQLPRLTVGVLGAAVERSWDRARDRFRGDWDDHDPEWLHETRKRCQRLLHQLMLLEALRPRELAPVRRGLAEAGEALGSARDTGLLLLRTRGVLAPEGSEMDLLRKELRREHREGLREARKAGRRALRLRGEEVRREIEASASEYAARFAETRRDAAVRPSRSSTA